MASIHDDILLLGDIVLGDHVTNYKHISTATVPMATKLGRVVTHLQELLVIMLLYLWLSGLARSRDKLKALYPHYQRYLRPPNLA